MTNLIKEINVVVETNSLVDGCTGDELDSIDVEASVNEFCVQLNKELTSRYKDVLIDVDYSDNMGSGTIGVEIEDAAPFGLIYDTTADVKEVEEKIFNAGNFWV